MLDVRKPLGLLFVILGALLFFYGMFFSQAVTFYTPYSSFPLKLNQPVGAFMFVFGVIMLLLARYVELHTLDVELSKREKEFDKVERRRQKALEKQAAKEAAGGNASAEGSADASAADASAADASAADASAESAGTESASDSADSGTDHDESNNSR